MRVKGRRLGTKVGDIAALMDRAGLDRAVVLGSSLGGYLAQLFAAAHPERTAGLVAASTLHSVRPIQVIPPYALDLDTAPIAELRGGFARGLEAWAEAHPDQRGLVELLMGDAGGRIPEAELRARLKALKGAPELPPVPLPAARIATVQAADDPLIPANMRAAVRARLSPARAFRFAWGGHFPYVVRAAAYTALIEEMLGLPVTGEAWPEGEAPEA